MTARRLSLWFGAVLLCMASVGAADAHADEGTGLMKMGESDMSDSRARAHFQVGQSLYDSGRFPEAAQEWEQAYTLSKRDGLLYNIYVAHRDASDLPKAIDALSRYLATDKVEPKQRLNLEARLSSMQAAQAAATQARAAEPAATPAAEPAAPAPAAKPEPKSQSSVLPLVLVISGGALVVTGLVTGVITNGKVSAIEKACPGDACPSTFDLDGKRSTARTLATVTDILLVGGGVVATVGVVLWLLDDGADTERASADASLGFLPELVCAQSGCAASVHGTF